MAELTFPEPPLTDGVVILRPWREDDAEAVAAWGADPEILRWTQVPEGYTPAQAREWLAQTEVARRADEVLAFAVADAVGGRLVGSCDLRFPDGLASGRGETGYLVDPAARGRGVAVRGVGLLVEWALSDLGLVVVQAFAHPDNVASQGVLRRLGFVCLGLRPGLRERDGRAEDRLAFERRR